MSNVPLPPSPPSLPTQPPSGSNPPSSNSILASNRLYDIPSLENSAANFQTWKFRILTVLDIRGLLPIVDGTSLCPTNEQSDELKDEPLNGVLHANTSKEVWNKLIGELFRTTFTDESPLEPQLNAMRHKAYILSSLGLKLEDALIAIAMVISLPESRFCHSPSSYRRKESKKRHCANGSPRS